MLSLVLRFQPTSGCSCDTIEVAKIEVAKTTKWPSGLRFVRLSPWLRYRPSV
jgi:hypothetical protein